MEQIEEVKKKEKLLAMIIRNNYTCDGVDFITPNEYSQQVAYMHHPTGKTIRSCRKLTAQSKLSEKLEKSRFLHFKFEQ